MKFESLDSRISRIFREKPGKIAIDYGDARVSYLELEKKSNTIANYLHNQRKKNSTINRGITQKQNVLILLDRSPQLILSILGVLKCGLIFIPVDPLYPVNRIKLLLKETGAECLITSTAYYQKLKIVIETVATSLNIILLVDKQPGQDNSELAFERIFNKYSYIYFTSGSTGVPMGVLGRNKSLAHYIDWEIKEFGVDENFKVSQFTSPSFDPFLRDIFVPLMAEATCCIPSYNILMNPIRLLKWIDKKEITLAHMVPSLFKALLTEIENPGCFGNLKYILLAGELLRGKDTEKFFKIFKDKVHLVNIYGPTETTLAKFFYRITPKDVDRSIIPVGKPIKGCQVLILDDKKRKCPVGDIGEVFIRTPFISSGYFNDSALTKKTFIRNPYTDNPQDLIYKSGDLGRILPGGNLELVGRVDHQVKIRGMRVEIGEIEFQILKHNAVQDVVVIDREDKDNNKYLTAYIVLKKEYEKELPEGAAGIEKKINIYKQLKEYLAGELPGYMIPSYFHIIDRIPLTPNRKVDRKALPEPDKKINIGQECELPRNSIDEKLSKIFSDILKIKKVGINDDFLELGGKSLDVMRLVSEIYKTFQTEISVTEVYHNAKLKAITESIIVSSYQLEKPVVLLNEVNHRKVFCFPPAVGYGLGYDELSRLLDDYSLYSFNFIEDEKRLEIYVDLIRKIQANGPYVLFGWSAAGSLTFDVANALEKRGCEVSDIILVDSSRDEEVKKQLFNEEYEEKHLRFIDEDLKEMGVPFLAKRVKKKMKSYFEYNKALLNLEIVNATVHFIASVERKNITKTAGWEKYTGKSFIVYNGFGKHHDMLETLHVENNAKIIKKILEQIYVKSNHTC